MTSIYDPYITDASTTFGIPPTLLEAQLQQESSMGENLGSIGNIGQVTQPALTDINSTYGSNLTMSDLTDPIEGIWAAAAYDAIQYNQAGTYTGMLQAYGTIPQDLTQMTPSQTALQQIAQNLDWFGSTSAGAPVTNTNAPGASIASAAASNTGVVSGIQSFLSFITSGQGWQRIGIIVIGFILLAIAGFMLATKGFEGTVRTIQKAT